MATRTISIDLEAYDRLERARRSPNESFSKVIKRARWPSKPRTAAGLLEALREVAPASAATLDRLAEAQRTDAPPEDAWDSD